MNVLSIGNSFSQDAHQYLNAISVANGEPIEVVNLYIGGCPLVRHWDNVVANAPEYVLEVNGAFETQGVTIADTLKMRSWDVITLQQNSPLSGKPESYEPYLTNLIDTVRQSCPNAKLYFHQTWAYELDFDGATFDGYEHNQELMYKKIVEALDTVRAHGLSIIPCGSVIQFLRSTVSEFDYANGGLSLCRDGYHLSLDYGRYVAAAVWFVTLTGKPVNVNPIQSLSSELTDKLNGVINRFIPG